jgi:hypothetical protein
VVRPTLGPIYCKGNRGVGDRGAVSSSIEPPLPQVNTGDRPEKHLRRGAHGIRGRLWDDETWHGRQLGAGPQYSTTASAATRKRSIGRGKHRGASRGTRSPPSGRVAWRTGCRPRIYNPGDSLVSCHRTPLGVVLVVAQAHTWSLRGTRKTHFGRRDPSMTCAAVVTTIA